MANRFYNEKEKELNDNAIINALTDTVTDYENGAIIEVQDVLIEIVNAISDFDKAQEG